MQSELELNSFRNVQNYHSILRILKIPLNSGSDNHFPFIQSQNPIHAIRYLVLVVGNIYQRNIADAANGIHHAFKMLLLVVVKPLAGFIKYEQGGVFY
jgi:hypothetical protein